MSKGLIAFIVVPCVALIAVEVMFRKKSADEARERSNKIIEQLKTIDKHLEETIDERLDLLNKVLFDSLLKVDK